MHKVIYISLLLFSFLCTAQAQKKYVYEDTTITNNEEQYVAPDTAKTTENIPVEQFEETNDSDREVKPDTVLFANNLSLPDDSMPHWKNEKDFAYAKYLDSLLKDKKDKMKTKTNSGASGPGLISRFLSSTFMRVFLWTLAACFILFILYRLFLAEGAFKRDSKTTKIDKPEVEEEIISGESDFEALINHALQSSNYRQAVRYQYLKTLHKLADKKYIELARDKTNYQYVHEINNPEYQNEFAALTLNYEYVWYGEFAVEKNIYQKIEMNFTGLNKKL